MLKIIPIQRTVLLIFIFKESHVQWGKKGKGKQIT